MNAASSAVAGASPIASSCVAGDRGPDRHVVAGARSCRRRARARRAATRRDPAIAATSSATSGSRDGSPQELGRRRERSQSDARRPCTGGRGRAAAGTGRRATPAGTAPGSPMRSSTSSASTPGAPVRTSRRNASRTPSSQTTGSGIVASSIASIEARVGGRARLGDASASASRAAAGPSIGCARAAGRRFVAQPRRHRRHDARRSSGRARRPRASARRSRTGPARRRTPCPRATSGCRSGGQPVRHACPSRDARALRART